MSHQSGSSRLRGLFDVALQNYEKATNITLANHPLSKKLLNCHSIESITTFLQDEARGFVNLQGGDRMLNSIKNTVSILSTLSATSALGDVVYLVCPEDANGGEFYR
jgi:hypothetical protein